MSFRLFGSGDAIARLLVNKPIVLFPSGRSNPWTSIRKHVTALDQFFLLTATHDRPVLPAPPEQQLLIQTAQASLANQANNLRPFKIFSLKSPAIRVIAGGY
jgi:hypothetical protein